MFTLEIGGKPVAVTDAEADEAKELFESEPFKDDLKRLQSEGKPLWNGTSPLNVRPATEEEILEFEDSEDEDEEEFEDGEEPEDEDDEEEEDDEAAVVMFLVPITDPDWPEEE